MKAVGGGGARFAVMPATADTAGEYNQLGVGVGGRILITWLGKDKA